MDHIPPALADFARRLFDHEAAGAQRTQELADAMERVCQALRTRLTPLVSLAGFNALLARAVTLATRDFPFLATIGAINTPNGSLGGLRQAVEGREPAEAAYERSDVCVVPAAGVIVEAMCAIVLATAALEKFGGDSMGETLRNWRAFEATTGPRSLRE